MCIQNLEKEKEASQKYSEQLKAQLQENQLKLSKSQKENEESLKNLNDLNTKNKILTQELEKSSKKLFESSLQIEMNEELQRSMTEMAEALKKAENEIKLRISEVESARLEKNRLETICSEQAQKVEDIRFRLNDEAKRSKELENRLRATESSFQGEVENITKQLNYAVSELEQVKNELEEKKSLQEEVKLRMDQINKYQAMIRALENTSREQERAVNLAKAQENTLKDRIKEFETIIHELRTEKSSDEKKYLEKIKNLESDNDQSTRKYKLLAENFQEKEAEISKNRDQISSLLIKNEETLKKSEQVNLKLTKIEQRYKEIKNKCSHLETENQEYEKCISLRENQIKELLNKMKLIESELFTKDSTILQKDGTILKLSKEIDDHKRILQQAHSKFRATLAEELKNFNNQLEQKEQEIKILKDMIRSGKTQLKQKEGEVYRYKNMLQPQSSTRTLLEGKKNETTENSMIIDSFLNAINRINDLKSLKQEKIKENNENSYNPDPVIDKNSYEESVISLVTTRFEEIVSELQKKLKKFLSKNVETKFLHDKVQTAKEEMTVKELIEIISSMSL